MILDQPFLLQQRILYPILLCRRGGEYPQTTAFKEQSFSVTLRPMSPLLNCDSHKSPGKLQSNEDQNESDRYVKGREQSEVLALENFEESDLHLYIRSSLKSNFRAEATRQLLSRLMTIDSTKAEEILAKEFDRGQDGELSNGVSDIDLVGNAIMENQTRSPREFWQLLKVRLPL